MSTRWLLTFVFTFFMLLMGAVWIISKRANPVFLDEHGRPVTHASSTPHHG